MVDTLSLILISIFVPLIIFAALFLLRSLFMKKGLISRSLNLELLLVRFPPPPSIGPSQSEPSLQQTREKIALMEQLYV
ncbi:MAG TPA: hypothetical protein VJB62_01455, partial [Patescibacteria group bacterium]|nr:hypothetical protein [Patescibacteria group bacterium]